jgi:hypothetical protein
MKNAPFLKSAIVASASAKVASFRTALLPLLLAPGLASAEPGKPKVLDSFQSIDAKTLELYEVKAKIVNTKDPKHPKGLEVIADFAKPNTWPRVFKKFPEGFISTQKYSGVRFSAKSDTSTRINLDLRGSKALPDGRVPGYMVEAQLSPEWKEFTFNFSDFKSWEQKVYKDGKQTIFKGGEPIQGADYELFNRCGFTFDVTKRGTGTSAQIVVDDLVLLTK